MILVVDVGNTNLTWGVYDGKVLKATFRMTTKTPRTSDEYGVLLTEMLRNHGVDPMELEGSIVASVVPDVMHALLGALRRIRRELAPTALLTSLQPMKNMARRRLYLTLALRRPMTS